MQNRISNMSDLVSSKEWNLSFVIGRCDINELCNQHVIFWYVHPFVGCAHEALIHYTL